MKKTIVSMSHIPVVQAHIDMGVAEIVNSVFSTGPPHLGLEEFLRETVKRKVVEKLK